MKRFIASLLLAVPVLSQAHWDSGYYHGAAMAGTTVKADWMKYLPDAQSIMQVSIPGTHNSGSRFGGPYVQTQTYDIATQLRAGIRYMDIRLRPINGALALHHGPVYQNMMFGEVVRQVRTYLQANPSEFVLMRIKEEYSTDPNFDRLVRNYLDMSPNSFVWQGNGYSVPTVGEARGKLVVLRDYSLRTTGAFGASYHQFIKEDNWKVSTNWDLYSKWERSKAFLNRAQLPGNHGLINYLSGSDIAFPYFVASGHSSPGTSAARLSTGLTTPGWNSRYPDFPRVNCFIGICTIAFEGTNVLARQLIVSMNAKKAVGTPFTGSVAWNGLISNSPYVGIVAADFPGPGLIEAVVAANRFYSAANCTNKICRPPAPAVVTPPPAPPTPPVAPVVAAPVQPAKPQQPTSGCTTAGTMIYCNGSSSGDVLAR